MFNKIVHYFLENKLFASLLLLSFVVFGMVYSPLGKHQLSPGNSVSVDAIPNVGDNQQIVSTEWMGRSPKDIQDQITYPLTSSLLGIPGVKTIRSTSMFGMSFIYIIFKDNVEFYWSRSRILEKLNSLPKGTLPEGVQPSLGPDATALGQIFWYTLEGRDPKTGKPNGGWDPQELRTIQDFQLKYSLASAEGVSEVASIGGYTKEYQVDLRPEALKAYDIGVMDVMNAVKNSHLDIGAETIELNQVEYVIRGLGYVQNLEDLENSVVAVKNNRPIRIRDVAQVHFGPATRRGGLDKGGSEAVGAVVVARHGSNPLEVIDHVKAKIKEMEAGMPQKTLPDGSISKVTVVPFYDRTGLIRETIGTLESALTHEILISIIVIILLVLNLRASLVVSGLLPIGVLITFIFMKIFGVEANIVALSGIAIAIGVMVDIGIVDVENILRHLEMPENKNATGKKLQDVIYKATTEVRDAVVTSIATTIVSFIPVFAMESAEGKLFHPLAFTKTFALLAAFILGITVLPTLVYFIFNFRIKTTHFKNIIQVVLFATGIWLTISTGKWMALSLSAVAVNQFFAYKWPDRQKKYTKNINLGITALAAVYFLTEEWLPLGPDNGMFVNFIFVTGLVGLILTVFLTLIHFYEPILHWALNNKKKFLLLPLFTLFFGLLVWLGFDKVFGPISKGMQRIGIVTPSKVFPGIGKEFMPSLNEGSFLLMPTTMPHAGVQQSMDYVRFLDQKVSMIPEIESAVGKWGRVQSALDPAPIQMFENTINYRSEYILDENGHRMRFKTNKQGAFLLKNGSVYNPAKDAFRVIHKDSLMPSTNGTYFRQWRPSIQNEADIWDEIIHATQIPGLTSAPKLQPIETRMIMLSTGMRAPIGLKIYGPNLESIEKAGFILEKNLKEVPAIKTASVFYDRAVGAPYLEIELDRTAMARYGFTVTEVQEVLQVAIGGMTLNMSVEGRERYPMRVRYAREFRDDPALLGDIFIRSMGGTQVPLKEIATIRYTRGAQMIQSENTFLMGYVLFDKNPGYAEVDVVEDAQALLKHKQENGQLSLPDGVTYKFTGNYENELRATKRLAIVIPMSLLLIFLLLYLQFKTITASFIHFSGVFVAFAGGFILLWLYGQDWFLNFSMAEVSFRDLFQIHPINMSVAVWVGFIALFGIATNDGVIMGTYIHQVFERNHPNTIESVHASVLEAGKKRVRPAMMTTAVAVIALLPVLTSTGKGAEIMIPMAIPTFGGMLIQVMTIFVVPVFQSMWREHVISKASKKSIQIV